MTVIHEFNLDILRTEIFLGQSKLSEVRGRDEDRQTDRRDRTHYHCPSAGDNNNSNNNCV